MRKVFSFWLLAVLVLVPSFQADARRPGFRPAPAPSRAVRVPPLYAGFRSSRYGISPFPNPLYWALVGKSLANRFPEGRPGGVWLVGVVEDDSGCRLNFPSPGGSFAHVYFMAVDQNEEFFRFFDAAGVSVWLQVEPGDADVSALIDLVLRRYGSHACLRGIGVDVEWLAWRDHRFGRAVTDSEALAWSARVASYNSAYSLFLKHWMVERMPPHYRGTILFVDDSQEFPSLAAMVEEFQAWGRSFPSNPVAFQFGYEADKTWWRKLVDPPGDIGKALLRAVPNVSGLFWVDFTLRDVFPPRGFPIFFAGPDRR